MELQMNFPPGDVCKQRIQIYQKRDQKPKLYTKTLNLIMQSLNQKNE